MEVLPAREFSTLYIYLDIIWLVFYALILGYSKRYLAITAGLVGCVLYFAVDYGIFYLALDTRVVTGADPFWLLLWLSSSYGFTNFAWIWLLLDRDSYAVEWSLLTISGWLAVAMLSQSFGSDMPFVSISRGTSDYHGIMAFILAVGYLFLIIRNIRVGARQKVNILRLLVIGIGVQLSWEFVLLITGIRPAGIMPIIVDSLIETNLGMPYLYLVHRVVSRRFISKTRNLQV